MTDPLAIVGMACRVPGARDYRAFWANILAGSMAMVEVGEEDLRREDCWLDPDQRGAYVPRAAPLDGYEDFDHVAFGISIAEARGIDPGHRIMMEIVLEALEDASCDPLRHAGAIGLFASAGRATPAMVQAGDVRRPPKSTEVVAASLALDTDFLSTRIAYRLNLRGPCMTVQTACSSSLVALHLACQSVLSGESDAAIAGGVNIQIPHRVGYYYQQGSIWSPDGYCRPFDRAADGTIPGSGAGAVVVKRLDRAVADGDAIHAVIRGSAVNNDGNRKIGFTAPSVRQQSLAIGAALSHAGVDRSEIGYVEAHGTGTAVGDVVEWAAIERALGSRGVPCAIGAAKANVGHLGAAAGVIGVIKAALVLASGQIPPMANFVELNPQIKPVGNRLFVPRESSAWDGGASSRLAGVSAMGVGGTNVHLILEQAPPPTLASEPREHVYIVPVTAASERSTRETANRVADFAMRNPDRLASLAQTMRTGRRILSHREALVFARHGDDVDVWRSGHRAAEPTASSVLVLPGQSGNVLDLRKASTEVEGFADTLSDALACLPASAQGPVEGILTGSPEPATAAWLNELAVLVQSVVIARSLLRDGLRPRSVCGFSLGEIAAGVICGVFSLDAATMVLSERARILSNSAAGAMIRARISSVSVAPYLTADVSLAIVPGRRDCMLSGGAEAIEAVFGRLRDDRVACVRVPVAHPYHSMVLQGHIPDYTSVWSRVAMQPPRLRLISPTTGDRLDERLAVDPGFWASHLVRTVHFGAALDALRASGTDYAYVLDIEAGITAFVRETFAADALALTAGKQRSYDALSRARFVAAAWSRGQDIEPELNDEARCHAGSDVTRMRVHAPTYAFDHSLGKEHVPLHSDDQATRQPPHRCSAADRAPEDDHRRDGASHDTPEQVTTQVTGVVARLLGCSPADVEPAASFVELGYDSFLLIQLADALSEEFGTEIEVRKLFGDLDSCSGVCEFLSRNAAAPTAATIARAASAGPAPSRSGASGPTWPDLAKPDRLPVSSDDVQSGIPPSADRNEPLPTEAEYFRRTPISRRVMQEDRFALADQRNLMSFRHGRGSVSYPVVGARGDGARFVDVDGREYIDLCMGFGVSLLGHASEPLKSALREFDASDLLLGPQSSVAGDVARGLTSLVGVDRVAFTTSGTEAVMGAVRAVRAKTGRDLIALFSGSYHGTFDGVLAAPRTRSARGEAAPLGGGTPASMVADVVILPYDETAIPVLEEYGECLAAVLVEPVQSRRPGYQPAELLHRLRTLTKRHGAALVFDEIVTGFRCHPRGASAVFDVRPDLATYGKVIAGGLPIGVIAGDAEYMAVIDGGRWREGDAGFPQRPSMLFAGTFSKHPMTMAVAHNMIRHLKKESPQLQNSLTKRTAELARKINADAAANGFPIEAEHFSSLFRINVGHSPLATDMFFLALLNRGVYVWEGRTCFLSTAHTDADCAQIAAAVADAAAEVAAQNLWQVDARARAAGGEPARPAAAGAAPLTDGQKLLWVAAELGGALGESYQMSTGLRISGALDHRRLVSAMERVAFRHSAMRSAFDPDGNTQTCVARCTPELAISTLSSSASLDVESRMRQFALRPPELSVPSLFRFQLIETPEAAVLQCVAPHIVLDDWSCGILWSELSACYEAGEATTDLPDPADFFDYARRKRLDEDTRLDQNAAYWRDLLDGAWASGKPTQGTGPWSARAELHALSVPCLRGLHQLARSSGCTMHTAALSLFAVAASLETGVRESVVLAHLTGQPRHTDKPLIGFCVDMLPVIARLPDDVSLSQVASAIQQQILDSSGRTAGIYRVLQQRNYRRLPAGITAFNYARRLSGQMFGGAQTVEVRVPRELIPWPAIVSLEEHDEGIDVVFEVSEGSGLASRKALIAQRMEQIIAYPSEPILSLPRRLSPDISNNQK